MSTFSKLTVSDRKLKMYIIGSHIGNFCFTRVNRSTLCYTD